MENKNNLKNEIERFDAAFKVTPLRNALELIGLYIVIGVLWIFFSDMALNFLIGDPAKVEGFQLFKGLFYVAITGYVFYIIIKKRMESYYNVMSQLNTTLVKLHETNDSLRKLENELEQIAYYDSLTGLYTRNMITRLIDEHIEKNPNELLGLVYIDIDDFSNINEIKGHTVGDELILLLSNELKRIAGQPHQIGRIGGDGFIILLKEFHNKDQMLEIIRRNATSLKKSFMLDHEEFYITVSIGVCIYPDDGITTQALLSNVDLSLGRAKELGKNQIVVYHEKYHAEMKRQIEISNMLYQAVRNREFKVFYQPIVNSKLGKATKVEALIRWHHPVKGNIPPLDFIGIAEKTGHIKEITYFVIKESIKQIKIWQEQNIELSVSVNLSARVLNDPSFLNDIQVLLKKFEGNPKMLILEITESAVLTQIDESIMTLLALKRMGFQIALDDFGTGYSSLTYLQRLPIDIIKIDRSFVRNIKSKDHVVPLLKFMIDVAHELKMKVVCEGIEELYEKEATIAHGSDYLQGFYYSRPNTAELLDNDLLNKKAQ
ncbi:bifunctional diguanylate cyclase/phosphodiesterase [Acholeplasma vituli]|uniref:Bifunctional diguanylate cyclase/phosphodiesterase n=1 Tax=Paracholeplasma vituli TaxID=69473 RepID=A0ABT2PXF1_9MOLU|nr:bifunctional diguanylate cyclase/phosphodiesterase [Paracholeplasma vituli]MCU0105636.1 bifunctional diguanylate cyclase/phosphodiesterase [Paracholeplasma vituli]